MPRIYCELTGVRQFNLGAVALRCRLCLDDEDGALGRSKNDRIFQRHQCVNFARFRV